MQFRLSLLFAFMALFACVLSQPISPQLFERGNFFSSLKSKPPSGIKPYTGPGALDTKGGGGGSGNPNIKAFYPTGNPNPETPLPHNQNSAASRTDAVAGKEDDYFGNWGAFGKHRRSLEYLLSFNYNGEE